MANLIYANSINLIPIYVPIYFVYLLIDTITVICW